MRSGTFAPAWRAVSALLGILSITSAVHATAFMYVSNYNTSTFVGNIKQVTSGGAVSNYEDSTHDFSLSDSSPQGLTFDPSGNMYVALQGNNSIDKFAPNGGFGSAWNHTGVSGPAGIQYGLDGYVYVANGSTNSIWRFDSSGNPVDSGHSFYNLSNSPFGLAFDNRNYLAPLLYISINATGTILRADVDSLVAPGTFATGLNSPAGLAVDGDGNLFVSNISNNTIVKITPTGTKSTFATTDLSAPRGLAFDSNGNLYAANYGNGTIAMFTPTGVASIFATGLNNPTFLYIPAPAPEPGTGAILLSGAAVKVLSRRPARKLATTP